jgi:hypothetical protein
MSSSLSPMLPYLSSYKLTPGVEIELGKSFSKSSTIISNLDSKEIRNYELISLLPKI